MNALVSIFPIPYSLVFPHESLFAEPLTWIGNRFPTSSVRILWEAVENAECVRWKSASELEQGFTRLCCRHRIEEAQEVMLVFGGNVPHIGVQVVATQAIIAAASEMEAECWIVPRERGSRGWVVGCAWSGELWFAKL